MCCVRIRLLQSGDAEMLPSPIYSPWRIRDERGGWLEGVSSTEVGVSNLGNAKLAKRLTATMNAVTMKPASGSIWTLNNSPPPAEPSA